MNVEQITGLERRARIHAALGDPARLSIIDTLRTSDASPTELGASLDMPSNLLAHHLKVLETEGLIARHRSEGDRRRSYVTLQHDVLASLSPGFARRASRVLFVCTANSARSHLAAALWRQASHVPAASAGTHPAARMHDGAVAVAERHNLPLRRLKPRTLAEVRDTADLIITVCDNAHEELPAVAELHWSVPDPIRTNTDAAFEHAFAELARRVEGLSHEITPPTKEEAP